MFMRVSQALNQLTSQPNQEQNVIGLAASLLDNIIISNNEHQHDSELVCLMRELISHIPSLENLDEVTLKKVKATIERAERYSNQFTEDIVNEFQDGVVKLGDKLGLDQHSVMVFSESFVRSHLIFQFSKCVDYCSQTIR